MKKKKKQKHAKQLALIFVGNLHILIASSDNTSNSLSGFKWNRCRIECHLIKSDLLRAALCRSWAAERQWVWRGRHSGRNKQKIRKKRGEAGERQREGGTLGKHLIHDSIHRIWDVASQITAISLFPLSALSSPSVFYSDFLSLEADILPEVKMKTTAMIIMYLTVYV